MLGLERVQFREALRIALGLMSFTSNNCLGVLSGIPPLAERFAYLNFRCLFAAFGPPFEGKTWSAGGAEHGSLHKIPIPAGVFTAELSDMFTALRHITEIIRPPERCLILTDSLSTIKAMLKFAYQTHPLVYECKQLCWSLCQNGIEVKLMWIPSHVGLVGNELVAGGHWKAPSSTDHYL
jgi:hypothetical protein